MALELGPVIGQIGGGGVEVQSQPVSWNTTSAANNSVTTVATINTGKVGDWRIVLVGTETQHTRSTVTSSSAAEWIVNGTVVGALGSGTPGLTGFSTEVLDASTITVAVSKNYSTSAGGSVWSGTAFWWPVD